MIRVIDFIDSHIQSLRGCCLRPTEGSARSSPIGGLTAVLGPEAADTSGVGTVVQPGTELVGASRERRSARLSRRDGLVTFASAAAFGATAGFLAALATGRHLDLGLAAVLIAAYALASRVEFEVGTGSAVATQLVFVAMLFLLPAGIVRSASRWR